MSKQVSIVIPCYNHARYLPAALDSVLAQTYIDWEAIIVDDGSTGNTREVAAQFTDPRIHYIYQENRGLPGARNTGIRAAQGKYLAFLDADDEWEPVFLERCVGVLQDQERDIAGVYTRNTFVDPHGDVLPHLGGQFLVPQQFRARLLEGGFFPVHSVLVRADCVREAGMFDETLTSVEDWDLWFRIVERDYTFQSIPEPLARYRIYPGSMSTNAARMHANRMAVLAKHFGPPEGGPAMWSQEKRQAYAFAYRAAVLDYLQQQEPDLAWHWLHEVARVFPQILARLDTFYELALGNQPRGYRGEVRLLDVATNGAEMLRQIRALFADASPDVKKVQSEAFGNAYLALAMLNDQAGNWRVARRCIRKAIAQYPRFLADLSVTRRLVKLHFGKSLVRLLRSSPLS